MAIGYGETQPDGTYTIKGLPSGTYRVEFFDLTGEHAYEFYDDAATLKSAKSIAVGTGATVSAIDATLGAAGKISGTVTVGGVPVSQAWVTVYRQTAGGTWEPVNGAETDADGTYTAGGLRTGTYRVELMYGADDGFGSEFYDNATTLRRATGVSVIAGSTTEGIDADLVISPWPNDFKSPGASEASDVHSTVGLRDLVVR